MGVRVTVVGSVNLDIVAKAERLPVAGETITDATLNRFPGGKGANQALAARRLGADVSLLACVGDDPSADEALALLRSGGVNLDACRVVTDAPTGTALIAVAASGENQIVVAPGANRRLLPDTIALPDADAVICQLEVPVDTLQTVCRDAKGLVCMNLAPALPIPESLAQCADLIVVNETEAQFYGEALRRNAKLLAVTHGSRGASLYRDGLEIATAAPPAVSVVDTTGAGDTFTAALTVALVEQMPAERALRFACTAGALATTVAGAQPSLPMRRQVDAVLTD